MSSKKGDHETALKPFKQGITPEPDFDPDKDPNGGWPTRRGRSPVSRVARNIGNGDRRTACNESFGHGC